MRNWEFRIDTGAQLSLRYQSVDFLPNHRGRIDTRYTATASAFRHARERRCSSEYSTVQLDFEFVANYVFVT